LWRTRKVAEYERPNPVTEQAASLVKLNALQDAAVFSDARDALIDLTRVDQLTLVLVTAPLPSANRA